jgi:hypothetical protein
MKPTNTYSFWLDLVFLAPYTLFSMTLVPNWPSGIYDSPHNHPTRSEKYGELIRVIAHLENFMTLKR